jgi:hypothetical protein
MKQLFRRKPRCPRCDSRNHVDPNVHNTRITQGIPRIVRMRSDLDALHAQDVDPDIIEYAEGRLITLWSRLQSETRHADPKYQDLELLIQQYRAN